MARFELDQNKSILGYINLDKDLTFYKKDQRIVVHQPKYSVNGDLRLTLEEFKSDSYRYRWVMVDSITVSDFSDLNENLKWKSSLSWKPNKDPNTTFNLEMISYIITREKDGLNFTEIRMFSNRDPEVIDLGCVLNKFNLMVIKKIIKDRKENNDIN